MKDVVINNKKVFIFSLVSIFILCLLIIVTSLNAGQFDLKISQLIAQVFPNERYSSNLFGRIFEVIGESPIYLYLIFMICSFGYLFKQDSFRRSQILPMSLIYILAILVGTFMFHRIFAYIATYTNDSSNPWLDLFNWTLTIKMALGIVITLVISYVVYKIKLPKKALVRLLIVSLIAIALSQLIVQIVLKPLMNRNRYRALMFLDGNVNNFTPWYQKGLYRVDIPSAIPDDFKSFPSGHTAAAATTFLLMLFPAYFDRYKSKKAEAICFSVPAIYTITVAVSRVVMGAHYLSDVTFGALITIVFIMLSFFAERMIANKRKTSS